MRLHKVNFEYIYDWGGDSEDEKVRKAGLRGVRAAFLRGLGVVLSDRDVDHPVGIQMSDAQVMDAHVGGFKLEVTETRDYGFQAGDDLGATLAKFQAVADKIVAVQGAGAQFNQVCQVHMPGQALSLYNEVLLKSDCCSDELQGELTRGWRIIAACPQPDQRRPDYILGRFNPEFNGDMDARRRG